MGQWRAVLRVCVCGGGATPKKSVEVWVLWLGTIINYYIERWCNQDTTGCLYPIEIQHQRPTTDLRTRSEPLTPTAATIPRRLMTQLGTRPVTRCEARIRPGATNLTALPHVGLHLTPGIPAGNATFAEAPNPTSSAAQGESQKSGTSRLDVWPLYKLTQTHPLFTGTMAQNYT